MTIAWTTVEDAIQDWVVTASGLAGNKVIWVTQNGPRPDVPYISIDADIQRVGQDWADTADAAVPAPGAEIDQLARGTRRMMINIQCFGGTATGNTSSRAILENVVSKFQLPSVRGALVANGVGVASFSNVSNISGVLNSTRFEPRATVEAVAFLASEVSETGTYFSKVDVTNEIPDPDSTFTVDGGV